MLPQRHAFPHRGITIREEYDAGGFEGSTDGRKVVFTRGTPAFLEINNDTTRNRCRRGKGVLIHFNQTSCRTALGWRYKLYVQR